MAGKSDYLENMLLDTLFVNGTFTKPTNVHIALHSADPTDAGTGTELSGGGYGRVSVANNGTTFNRTGNTVTNTGAISFTESTGSQGTATHFGIWTASTAGNLLYAGALGASRAVTAAGITVTFPASSITISED